MFLSSLSPTGKGEDTMGRQIRFYALPSDELKFWEFVQSIPDTLCLSEKSSSAVIGNFVLPYGEELPKPIFRKLYIYRNRKLNDLMPFLRKGSRKVYSEEQMDYIDTGEIFYWIDTNAPLVEFISSFFREDGSLTQGRLWVDLYKLEGQDFVYKGDDFKAFYETLVGWIRKNFKKLKGIDGYFGEEALAWYKSGGRIV